MKNELYDGFKTREKRAKRVLEQRNLSLRKLMYKDNYSWVNDNLSLSARSASERKYSIYRQNTDVCEISEVNIDGIENWIRESDLSGITV